MLEDFQKLAKKLGLPIGRKDGGLVIHLLRHYFKTTAVDSGVPNYVTDAWMGHSDSSMGRQYGAERQEIYMFELFNKIIAFSIAVGIIAGAMFMPNAARFDRAKSGPSAGPIAMCDLQTTPPAVFTAGGVLDAERAGHS
jgi:hypothetical protein